MARHAELAKMNEAVGAMTRQFAMLELVLHYFVWALMGKNEGAFVVTRGMSFAQLVNLVKDLVEEGVCRGEGRRDRIRKLVQKLKAAGQERNRFIHALTEVEGGELMVGRVRDLISIWGEMKAVDVSEVERLTERCRAVGHDVSVLIQDDIGAEG